MLAACASLQQPQPPPPQMEDIPRFWSLDGRIGVVMDDRGWHAGLSWKQRGQDFHVRMSGPLGSGAVQIDHTGGELRARSGDGREYRGAELDRWSREQFGQPLPVRELPFWLLGRARPGRPASLEPGAHGLPRALTQSGWKVRFEDWASFEGRTLPRRLTIERGEVRVKLLVRRWQEGRPGG